MATQTKILRTTVVYPISNLSAINAINQNSLIELSIKTSDSTWESRQTTISDFGNYIITSHAIFNNLYDLYCTEPDCITFTKPTYFSRRPYVRHIGGDVTKSEATAILSAEPITDNASLVTLYDVKDYIRKNGIAVQAVGKNSRYRYYAVTNSGGRWLTADKKPSVVNDSSNMKSIYSSVSCLTFGSFNITSTNTIGYATAAHSIVTAEKDMMINVIANFLLTMTYDELTANAPVPYYNFTASHWLALIINGNNNEPIVGTISRFTDIVNVTIDDTNYAIAQVKLSMPISKGTQFYLYTPADINTNISAINDIKTKSDKFKRSLFDGLNEAHVAYFDNDF